MTLDTTTTVLLAVTLGLNLVSGIWVLLNALDDLRDSEPDAMLIAFTVTTRATPPITIGFMVARLAGAI